MPSALLQKRVVSALRERGFFRLAGRRYLEVTAWRVAWVCAASVVLVVVGFALGQRAAWPAGNGGTTSTIATGDLPVAALVQRAGTAYVAALEELAMLPDSTRTEDVLQGREVALNALYTAAQEMIRIVPSDVLADQILTALEDMAMSDPGAETDEAGRPVIWF
jgi:hypothetical protein